MDHSTSSFQSRGGITIFTQTWRPPGHAKALVVLVHGYAEHSGRYEHVAEALTNAGYVVAALDLRGHGRSSGPRALFRDFGELTSDLAMFRQELAATTDAGLPQVLVGHSMGGAVVLDHLLGEHLPVAAVVLSGPFLRNATAVAPPLRMLAPLVAKIAPGLATQKLSSADVSRDPEVVRDYDNDPLNYRGGTKAATGAQLLGVEARILTQVSRISEPVLIVHGSSDRLAALAGSRVLVEKLGSQDKELKVYDGLYHEVFNEPEQKEVLADVVAWLDERIDQPQPEVG